MKKKIILALIFIALLIAIFMPAEAIGLEKGFKEFAIIFYAAATVLASLSLSSIELSDAIRMYRLFLLLCTGIGVLLQNTIHTPVSTALIGFLTGCFFIIFSVITTPAPLGRSYFWPLVPFNRAAMRSVLFRYPAKRKQPPQIWNRK